MAGKFEWRKFSEVNLDDHFFDELKADYEEFPVWFKKKSDAGKQGYCPYLRDFMIDCSLILS